MKAHEQLGLLDEPDDGLSLGEWMATLPRTPFEEEVGEKGPTVWEARAHSVPFLSAALQGPGGALENAARLAKTPTEE